MTVHDNEDKVMTSETPEPAGERSWRPALQWLRFGNIGAVYVWILIIVVFSIWVPDTFPTWQTVRTLLNQNAVVALVAVSIVLPLAARTFDLSIGFAVGLANVFVAWVLVHTGMPIGLAVLLTIGFGVLIGVLNGLIVVVLGVDSFIGTLGTGAVMQALITMITNEQPITSARLTGPFSDIATTSIGGLQMPVFYTLAVMIVVWWILEHTVTGRRMYATGFNVEAARLSGVPTKRLRFAALIVAGVIAGIAGVIIAAQIGAGSPDAGPPYLLSAYAAAFLGATQLRPGRFNAFGTVIAVLMIATGTTGLVLAGAPSWAPDMFTGVVLLVSLVVTRIEGRPGFLARRAGASGERSAEQAEDPVAAAS